MATPYIQRINRFVERHTNARGGSPLVRDVDPAVHIEVQIKSGVEDRYLQGWNRFGVQTTQSAVAAQFSGIRLRNPAGTNVIVVIESLRTWGALADQPFATYLSNNVDFGTTVTPTKVDLRVTSGGSAAAIISHGSLAAVTGLTGNQAAIAAAGADAELIRTEDQEMVVAPGDSVTLYSNVVNQLLNALYVWRERALEPSELT